jgi:opacity protein-like surface antigen
MFFLLAGVGFANTTLYLPDTPYPNTGGTDPNLIANAGIGLKVFAMESVALRVEYRYQRFFGAFSSNYPETGPDDISYHLFLVGFSVFRK